MKRFPPVLLVLLTMCSFVFSQADIRDIDFRNFTYQPYCAGPGNETRTVAIKDGMFTKSTETDGFANNFYFTAFDVVYGDVDGDNSDEAIILTLCNTGGTGNFTEGFVYGMKEGAPSLLARIEGGDRAFGGLRNVSVDGGIITVERSAPGELGGACCPEEIETTTYRFENNGLVRVGERSKREIYPAERIEFEEGKSTKLLKLRTSPDDQIKRFVVSAKKGQTMEVITSSPDAKVRLYKGNASLLNESEKVFYGIPATNEFAIKLKENGDYVFEVSNFSDIELNFFLTVKIK